MVGILFNDAEPFEQIDNTPSTESPNLVKTGQAVSKKTCKDYDILYMYIAQGQGKITLGDKIFVVIKCLLLWSFNVSFSHSVF